MPFGRLPQRLHPYYHTDYTAFQWPTLRLLRTNCLRYIDCYWLPNRLPVGYLSRQSFVDVPPTNPVDQIHVQFFDSLVQATETIERAPRASMVKYTRGTSKSAG